MGIDFSLLDNNLSLKNLLDRFSIKLLEKLNCVKIGQINTFYANSQTADIKIDGYPLISGVPVQFIFGGDFSIQVPIKQGDACIVLFCDIDNKSWLDGKTNEKSFDENHGLNGAIALVGLSNLNTKISNYITDGVRIKYKNSIIELKDSGIIINGNVTVNGDVIADGISLKNHTHKYTKAQSADNLVSVTDNTQAGE